MRSKQANKHERQIFFSEYMGYDDRCDEGNNVSNLDVCFFFFWFRLLLLLTLTMNSDLWMMIIQS